jgi:hypothetical protein
LSPDLETNRHRDRRIRRGHDQASLCRRTFSSAAAPAAGGATCRRIGLRSLVDFAAGQIEVADAANREGGLPGSSGRDHDDDVRHAGAGSEPELRMTRSSLQPGDDRPGDTPRIASTRQTGIARSVTASVVVAKWSRSMK